jgi:protein involved in polysaccharide export with SLBB domain
MFAALALGCSGMRPIAGVPAHRLPPALLGERRNDRERIDLLRLRQDPPEVYLLAPRDILGVYIAGVVGNFDEAPPVHVQDKGGLPPAIGVPFPVREDGTVSLPLVPPIPIDGLTVAEAEEAIKRAYTSGKKRLLRDDDARIVVTLWKRRAYQVMVVREDSVAGAQVENTSARSLPTGPGGPGSRRGAGFVVNLDAEENDVLRALNYTGGLPGQDAKNEVLILRGAWRDAVARDRMMAALRRNEDPCNCCRKLHVERRPNDPDVTRIPLRYDPSHPPEFDQNSIVLGDGDVVLVEAREADVFYTGGLLGGGVFQLPRDRDLDVLGAISMAGGQFGGGIGAGGGRGGAGFGGGSLGALIPPSEIIVVRNFNGCGALTIKADANRALVNPAERILIQPEDVVILRYTPGEMIANMFLSTVNFNFLFNGFNRGF